jgi:hypothetical protein
MLYTYTHTSYLSMYRKHAYTHYEGLSASPSVTIWPAREDSGVGDSCNVTFCPNLEIVTQVLGIMSTSQLAACGLSLLRP